MLTSMEFLLVIYHASAAIEARIRGTVITIYFTMHSNVAKCTVTGIVVYYVLHGNNGTVIDSTSDDDINNIETYNTCCSIPARIWLTVIDVDLTAVALKPSGTLTSVCINKILNII